MSKGTGSLQTFQHSKAGGGPPPTVTAANDGVLLDGTTVKLGQPFGFVPGDPAQLLEDRRIPLFGFRFLLDGNVIGADFNDTATHSINLFDAVSGNSSLLLDFANSQVYLGDSNNFIDPVLNFKGNAAGGPSAELYQQDVPGATWFDLLMVGSVTPSFDLTMQGAVKGELFASEDRLRYTSAATDFLLLDPTSDGYHMGRPLTGPVVSIDANHFHFTAGSNDYILADLVNKVYEFGDRINGPFLHMDNTTPLIQMLGSIGVNPIAEVFRFINAGGNAFFSIGDRQVFAHGTFIEIDDTAGEFILNNSALNSKVRINNVLGFTGTVTPVNSITVNGGIVTAVS